METILVENVEGTQGDKQASEGCAICSHSRS